MRVLSTSVPIFTSDFEAAIERYEALTRETVRQRFEVPERGIRIAILGSLQGPSPTPAGTNLIVRDTEGVVFEFVEPHSKE
jgi:hypothetical protein